MTVDDTSSRGQEMFLRRCKRRKNGKQHMDSTGSPQAYWALVESYRTARGSRQRIVAYGFDRLTTSLSELKANEQTCPERSRGSGWAHGFDRLTTRLGRHLDKKSRPQPSLGFDRLTTRFDPPHYDDPTDDEPVEINLKGIRLERLCDFGDVWLALGLWRLLGLDKLLSDRMPAGREEICWDIVAAIFSSRRRPSRSRRR